MKELALAATIARRELRGGLKGFRIFLACLVLGVGAIAAIGAIAAAVEAGLRTDAKLILGGDVEVRLVHRPASKPQRAWLAAGAAVSETIELRAMAAPAAKTNKTAAGKKSRLLVEVKAVDERYPLYGDVTLAPAMPLARALAPEDGIWGAAVDRSLLVRLGLAPGDRIRVGDTEFAVRAVIAREPDRAATAFTLGPRLMIAREALAATGLVQPGSLIRYYYRLRFAPATDTQGWIDALAAQFPTAGWRVRDPAAAAPRIRRFVDRVAMFLTLVGLTALLVGGVGAANATRNYLEGRTATIATLKCLGAPGRLIFRAYLLQILALAALAIVGGLAIGAAAPSVMVVLFGDALPVAARAGIYPEPLALAAVFGLLTALAFAVWPLARARDISPASLFRNLVAPMRGLPRPGYFAVICVAVAALVVLAIATAHDKPLAMWFVAVTAGIFLIFRGVAWLAARSAAFVGRIGVLMRGRPGLRLALANLHRPGTPMPGIVLSLGLGLTVLVAVAQIQGNLGLQINERLPEAAPSFYFIDIQPDQADAFDRAVNAHNGAAMIERVPSLRGRITRIAGVPVEQAQIAPEVRWTVNNERGLTYADGPPPGTVVTAGTWWAPDYAGPALVSLDEKVAHGFGVGVGDTLSVNVLGRSVQVRIANLRRIDWTTLGMNFVLVFSPGVLAGAPYTHIATARVVAEEEDALLERLGTRFPNVSAIRVKDAIETVNTIMTRLGIALRATTGITLVAGILVLGGAVAAGHRRRVYDSVVLKVLGATRGAVLRAYLLEYGFLGLATAGIAAALGTAASYLVLTQIMDFEWTFLAGETALAALGAAVVTLALGFAGVWRALGKKASPILRNP